MGAPPAGRIAATRSLVVNVAVAAVSTKTPSRSTLTRSEISRTSFKRCEMKKIPMPSALSFFIWPNRLLTSRMVRADVGSSKISTRALRSRPRMISISCWLAMLNSPAQVEKSQVRPSSRARRSQRSE